MRTTYYETLGVSPKAKTSEIKAAYRKLVLKHHPDRNSDPAAPTIFRGIAEAFEVLGDPGARRKYDDALAAQETRRREEAERIRREEEQRKERLRRQVEAASRAAVAEGKPAPTAAGGDANLHFSPADIAALVKRLSILFSRQRFADCEGLARQIIQLDPRQALPYAVLGDIARARGNGADALKMYSFALQMDPTNATFLRQYEEILDRMSLEEGKGHRVKIEPQEKRLFAELAIAAITLLASIYIVLSPEKPPFSDFGVISTWTIGVIAMLFISGAAAGAALSIGNLIDRVDAYSNGKAPQALVLGLVSILSFPLAAVAYSIQGLSQRAFSITTTRMMLTVAAITLCLSLGGAASSARVSMVQVLLWGGNLVYLGALGGWTLADNLKT
jgi:curved DNA-binding protein CbpA